ncbi:MAG: PVC-type heme-binding CxxCH protein [Planctomycetaceae bacterium]
MIRVLMLLVTLLSPQNPVQQDLVESIEQQRGGRHWIDQPTEPPKSPNDSLKCFQIEPGFRIELVASEPLVFDPVAIDFDHRGRMFVAEYSDYPVGPADPAAPALSRVVLLDDADGDGKPDKRFVFADHLKFCHSVMAFRDGALACTETQIVYLPDTNGDNVADTVEVWFDGFIPAHPQMQIGCPRYGLDNWIYLTYGHGKVRCVRPGFETAEPVEIPRVDFRFHPDTMKFEAITGAGQFGNTIDSFGRRYFSSNRNPIMTDVLTLEMVRRNPFAGVSVGHTDVGPAGEKTRVYPVVTMKSNWLSHAGTHTSACGVTAYRGGLFGPESDASVFVCEPVGHLVTRSVIEPSGGTVTSRRAREKADFLTSTDTWFRPASLATGPDGALYVADMYRLWVEHPKFVPDDVAAKMNWRAGEDRGRIWRVVAESVPADVEETKPFAEPKSNEELIAMLADRNGWRRLLAQRLLVERKRADAVQGLRKLLPLSVPISPLKDGSPQMLHALWTLDGLGQLQPPDLDRIPGSLSNEWATPFFRDCIRLAHDRFPDNADLLAKTNRMVVFGSGEVQLQAILTTKWMEHSKWLDKAVPRNMDDPWIQRAWLIAAPQIAANIAAIVVKESQHQNESPEGRADFLRLLSLNVAVRGDLSQLTKLMTTVGESKERGLWWQTAIVLGLADGLPRCQNPAMPKSLAAIVQNAPAELKELVPAIDQIVQKASDVAVNRSLGDADRMAAMNLMTHLPPEQLTKAIEALLSPGESSACQKSAVESIRRSGRADLADMLLTRWDVLNPLARSSALDLLLIRKETTGRLLTMMTAGTIPSAVISIDQRLILLKHPDESIRTASISLFGGTVSANRREVADQYSKSLELTGDANRGAAVFEKTCSKCHRIGTVGHNVGPDISDTRARAKDALLYDILDPNRRVDPQFTEYVIVTKDGRLLNGLLISESAESITLRQPEGREVTLPRTEIEELKSTSKSLMPEGIERDVTVEQMADVLAFLKK